MDFRTDQKPNDKPLSGIVALGVFSFGCYLLVGAYFSWVDSTWPSFLPPQLDVFGLLFRVFGEEVGARVGAIFLALLGTFFTVGAAVAHQRAEGQIRQTDMS